MKTFYRFALSALVMVATTLPVAAADKPYPDGGAPKLNPLAFPNLTAIYRFAGVRDNGGNAGVGSATVFNCSNFTAATQTVRIQVRDFGAAVVGDKTFDIAARDTRTAATHDTIAFSEDQILNTVANTAINQGLASISATNANVHCSAMIIDASTTAPVGVTLNGVRLNAAPGTQE